MSHEASVTIQAETLHRNLKHTPLNTVFKKEVACIFQCAAHF